MIKLNELNIKNFFSHSDTTIKFDELDGLVLLEGQNQSGQYDSNGSGKSSVLEGIVYALTGNTLRNVGVNDMVNRIVGKDTMARLKFTNNSVPMIISRYRKDEKFGDSIVFVEDGIDISSRLNKSTQETINNKLGIPYNVLVNTILLGEGLSSRFTQLSDSDKKSLIESTLSLSYNVNTLRDKVNSYIKELKLDISSLTGSISSMRSMIESFDPTDTSEKDSKRLIELGLEKKSLMDKMDSILSQVEVYNLKIKVLQDSKIKSETLHKEFDATSNRINELSVTMHNSCTNRKCPTCGQSLDSEESQQSLQNNYMNEINNLKNVLDSINQNLLQLPEYSVITSKLNELLEEKYKLDNECIDLNNKLLVYTSEISSLESNIESKKRLMSEIDNYKKKLSIDEVSIKEKTVDLSDYEYMYKLFSPTGLIVYILEDAVSYINERLSIYTDILIDKSYRFLLNKGKLGLVDSTGASYQSLSNGEKRRLDIAIQFSLHDYVHSYCGLQIDSLFVDEIMDTLDSVGIDNIIEVLRLKMEYCKLKSVIVITHNPNLKDKFDRILTVVKKEDGFSYLK